MPGLSTEDKERKRAYDTERMRRWRAANRSQKSERDFGEGVCLVCKCTFKKRTLNKLLCSPECAKARKSERAIAKYRETSTKSPRKAGWEWMRVDVENRGARRTILHVLEEHTENGTFPWPDVLTIRSAGSFVTS